MDIIFAYAGTLSLENELIPVDLSDMEIGDVFIQGGSPGHAVVVVDIAVNESTAKPYLKSPASLRLLWGGIHMKNLGYTYN